MFTCFLILTFENVAQELSTRQPPLRRDSSGERRRAERTVLDHGVPLRRERPGDHRAGRVGARHQLSAHTLAQLST